MVRKKKQIEKAAAERFGEMLAAFGGTISEILDDPKLRKKGVEFAQSVAASAKVVESTIKDEEMRAKFRDVGKAAQDLGKSLVAHFKADED